PNAREVFEPQNHVRVLVEDFFDVLSVVLAVDREEDTSPPELPHLTLKIAVDVARVGAPETDAGDHLLSDDPAPERVGQVEDQALAGRKLQGRKERGAGFSQPRQRV